MSTSPYNEAGKLLDRMLTERKGLKTLAFSQNKMQCTRTAYAQVCSTLRHKPIIDSLLDEDGGKLRKAVQFHETKNKGLLYVLLHELLFSKYRSIRGGGRLKRQIMGVADELREALARGGENEGGSPSALATPVFPRYVRVNTLKVRVEEAVESLREDLGGSSGGGEASSQIYVDQHVPDLLVLHPSTASRLYDHPLVKEGRVVLQDKSSCFSALALVHGAGTRKLGDSDAADTPGDYIDACSAPGNKTSHLAALIDAQLETSASANNVPAKKKRKRKSASDERRSKVFAFDRSSARVKILRNRIDRMVPDDAARVEVHPLHRDFLQADPSDPTYANVRSILLDPSCSGSGIVNNPDRHSDAPDDGPDGNGLNNKSRIEQLASFQLVALKHAMSFPGVRRIVYSTCSVRDAENEGVVGTALREHNAACGEDEREWELSPPVCLRSWKRRGRPSGGLTEDQARCLVRCDGLDGDETNGFFVAYLVRKQVDGKRGTDEDANYAFHRPESVPLYRGEFSESKTVGEGQRQVAKKVVKSKEVEGKTGTSAASVGKAKEVVCRKKAKKLAWKAKQKELKKKRLEAKKAKRETPT